MTESRSRGPESPEKAPGPQGPAAPATTVSVPTTAASFVEALQRSSGNRAVSQLLARESAPTAEGDPALVAPVPSEVIDEIKEPETLYGIKMPITVELLDMLTPGSKGSKDIDKGKSKGASGTYTYTKWSGKAFVKGASDRDEVDPNDIQQGDLGDCYLLAAMAAIARANPDAIRRLVRGPNADGTFDVTIYNDTGGLFKTEYTPKTVKVTPTFPTRGPKDSAPGSPAFAERGDFDPSGGGPELWVMLIEKAYAMQEGGYEKIVGGYGAPAMERLTGQRSKTFEPSEYKDFQVLATIRTYLQMGYAVTASADWYVRDAYKNEARAKGIILEHEYAVVSVDETKKTIDLQNPWGDVMNAHIKGLAVADFQKYFREVGANPVTARKK
jgi:calpain family cysteine protease